MDGMPDERGPGPQQGSGRPTSPTSSAVGRVVPVARGRARVRYPGQPPADPQSAADPPGGAGSLANGHGHPVNGQPGPPAGVDFGSFGAPGGVLPLPGAGAVTGPAAANGAAPQPPVPPGLDPPDQKPRYGSPQLLGRTPAHPANVWSANTGAEPPPEPPTKALHFEPQSLQAPRPNPGRFGAGAPELVGVAAEGTSRGTRSDDAGPRPGRSRHRSSRKRRQLPLWQEVPLLLLAAFLIAVLIRTFLLQAFFIPSGSMEHTLDIGDKVLVNKVVYDVREPARGEIVVFRGTDRWAPEPKQAQPGGNRIGRFLGDLVGLSAPGEKDFIKRVIGTPGDTVACCDAKGRVTVNGHPLDETYIPENSPPDVEPNPTQCQSRRFGPVTVPKGQVFVMGDHRLVSQDARCQGPVPIENIIGRAFLVVWPADRWKTLEVPSTFTDVPKPYAAPETVVPYRPATLGTTAIVVPLLIPLARRRRTRKWRRRRLSA